MKNLFSEQLILSGGGLSTVSVGFFLWKIISGVSPQAIFQMLGKKGNIIFLSLLPLLFQYFVIAAAAVVNKYK